MAKADVQAAKARLEEAQAELASFEAEVERWDSEVKRLQREVDRGRGRSPGPAPVDQPAQGEHRVAGRGQGDRHEGGRRAALRDARRCPGPRSTSGSPRPT